MPPSTHESWSAHPSVPNWKSSWIFKPILAGAGVFILACLAFTAPITYLQLKYAWSSHTNPALAGASATATSTAPTTTSASSTPAGVAPGSQLSITKIGVTAPIIYTPSTNETDLLQALQSGVVHYATTALPGDPGNVVIFGHSSEDWWDPGNYKFVFVLLDKLQAGDQMTVTYQSQQYTYVVTGSRVVAPTDFSVLNPTATPTLTLITCSPVGTSLKRLVVTAAQTSPIPNAQATAAAPPPAPVTAPSGPDLVGSPGASTDFWNFITIGWEKLFH